MDAEQHNKKIDDLLVRLLNREITDEEAALLERWITNDPDAIDRYCEFITDYAIVERVASEELLTKPQLSASPETDILSFKSQLWQDLKEHEKTAPAIEIPRNEPQQELIQTVVYEKVPHQISKFNLFSIILSAAAILFVVLFLKLTPEPVPSVDVATLLDQMLVQWADSEMDFENGRRLWTDEAPLNLKKGIVRIAYDKGAEIVIEGPALFEIERSGVYLEYGRLYSRVSETGLGFTVETPNSQFVDLGTEFGVLADINGSAELHVTKGKVQLFAGAKDTPKISRIVTENKAAQYDADSGRVEEVPISRTKFVRTINSKSNLMWKGQKSFDLSDVVSGGNGFGTGYESAGIVPHTGEFILDPIQSLKAVELSDYGFVSVPDLNFVDGVFIPHDGVEGIQVTSEGHIFKGGTTVDGAYYAKLISNGPLLFNGVSYGPGGHPVISMQRNKGITFDLDMIRQSLPGVKIVRFNAAFGLSDSSRKNYKIEDYNLRNKAMRVSAYVFVDGQERFSKQGFTIFSEPASVQVELGPGDRFLTLMTAYEKIGAHNRSFFAEPVLELE